VGCSTTSNRDYGNSERCGFPLPHILAAPLAAIDPLWRSGAAGSLLSVVCFVGNSLFLFLIGIEWTGSRIAGWLAFLFFAFNPHLIYLFTTPENEPLMILCITGLLYYLLRWIRHQLWKDLAFAALFAFAGTWTRYEGWAIAAAAVVLMPIITRRALRRNSNREDGCNSACASVPEPHNGKIATKRHKRSQNFL